MTMYSNEKARTLDYGFAETGERTKLITQFFHQVYLWMAIGLVWTAIVSWACAYTPSLRVMMSPGTIMMALLGAFAVNVVTTRLALRSPLGVSLALFVLYASLIGVAIGPIWIIYRQATIGSAFVLTGGIFFVMSLVGMVTKMDLSKVHAVAIMIGMGLVIGSYINYLFANNTASWFITYGIVIVFPILVMTETKQLKSFALANGSDGVAASKMAVVGALFLYVAFLNIFLSILRIMGSRR